MSEQLATHTYRKIDSTVTELVAHLDWKISLLPELAQRFNLSASAIDELRQNLETEKIHLLGLPPDANLGEIMESHFAAGKNFREGVTGKKED